MKANRREQALMDMSILEMNKQVIIWLAFGLCVGVVFSIWEAEYYMARLTQLGLPLSLRKAGPVNFNCFGISECVFFAVLAIRFIPYTLVLFAVGGGESAKNERFLIYGCTIVSVYLNHAVFKDAALLDGGGFGEESRWVKFLWLWRVAGTWLSWFIDLWAYLYITKLPIVNAKRWFWAQMFGVMVLIALYSAWQDMPPCPR